jgi:hypothetical protein
MKLAIVKTCFWLLAHLVVQKDTFAIATNLYVNKQYKESIRICTSQLNKLDMKDTLFEKYLFLRTSGYLESHDYASADFNPLKIQRRITIRTFGSTDITGS